VVINNPTEGGYYGGAISAPVFREIADRIYATDPEVGLTWTDTMPSYQGNPFRAGNATDLILLSQWLGYRMGIPGTNGWMIQMSDSITRTSYQEKIAPQTIPSVVGMGARDATYLLEKAGAKVQLSGVGLVQKQSIPAGSHIVPGTPVLLSMGF
jgi:cell division protein FtsI (penicillin-binding protein 3)